MKKVRKNISVPERNLEKLKEKADSIGIDTNGLINLLISGVIGNSDYQAAINVIKEVAPMGNKKTP